MRRGSGPRRCHCAALFARFDHLGFADASYCTSLGPQRLARVHAARCARSRCAKCDRGALKPLALVSPYSHLCPRPRGYSAAGTSSQPGARRSRHLPRPARCFDGFGGRGVRTRRRGRRGRRAVGRRAARRVRRGSGRTSTCGASSGCGGWSLTVQPVAVPSVPAAPAMPSPTTYAEFKAMRNEVVAALRAQIPVGTSRWPCLPC